MKKVLLTLTLAAFAFAANAQFVLGGRIDYSTVGGTEQNTAVVAGATPDVWTMPGESGWNINSSDLAILPKFGYQLNDNMQVGLSLGVIWSKTVDYSMWTAEYAAIDNFEGWQRITRMSVEVAPYFRYNLMEFGNFNLFCEASLGFTFGLNPTYHNYNVAYTTVTGAPVDAVDKDVEGYENTYTNIRFRVVPGLNYKLNDNFSADLYLNVAALTFSHYTERTFRDNNLLWGAPAGTPANTDEVIYNENRFDFEANMNHDYSLNTLFSIGFNYHF